MNLSSLSELRLSDLVINMNLTVETQCLRLERYHFEI
jgi:hypothetical protein